MEQRRRSPALPVSVQLWTTRTISLFDEKQPECNRKTLNVAKQLANGGQGLKVADGENKEKEGGAELCQEAVSSFIQLPTFRRN